MDLSLPADPLFSPASYTVEFRDRMSAHEAGHATMGLALGARIEAIYARIHSKLPNGNFRLQYLTRFDSAGWLALDLRAKLLLTGGGAAGDLLLIGAWDEAQVNVDRHVLEEQGFFNFQYCAEQAIKLLEQNKPLLHAIREQLRTRMSDMKQCALAEGGSHVVLVSSTEIDKLFGELGSRVSFTEFDLDKARSKT